MNNTPEMHWMMRAIQKLGWGNDYNAFLKQDFYVDFYTINKNKIPNDETLALEIFKNAIKKYILKRNPKSIFKTKLMTKKTEENLPFKNKVSKIEEKFLNYIKRQINQSNNKDDKKYNIDVINYFILQQARCFEQTAEYLHSYIKNNTDIIDTKTAEDFKNRYNKDFNEAFLFYEKFYRSSKSIKLFRVKIDSKILESKHLVLLSSVNCINLGIYNERMGNVLSEYRDILGDIDVAAISGNDLYFVVLNYNKYNEERLKNMMTIVAETWNDFSINTAVDFLIVPSSEDFLDYLTKTMYEKHINNEIEKDYLSRLKESKLLEIEKYLT